MCNEKNTRAKIRIKKKKKNLFKKKIDSFIKWDLLNGQFQGNGVTFRSIYKEMVHDKS